MPTYTWPLTINGVTFTAADFEPYGYVTSFPNLMGNFTAYAASVHTSIATDKADAVAAAAAAAGSASNAATSAVTTVTKASEATTAATNASANAATASTKAAEAAGSAASAAGRATTATTRAGEATTAATGASTSAATATVKAADASASATAAAGSATSATTKAGEAAASAIAAAGSANAAGNSAAAASASATEAAAFAGGGIKVSAADTTHGLLGTKLTALAPLSWSITGAGGDERYRVAMDWANLPAATFIGQARFANGSASAPAVSFAAAPEAGLFLVNPTNRIVQLQSGTNSSGGGAALRLAGGVATSGAGGPVTILGTAGIEGAGGAIAINAGAPGTLTAATVNGQGVSLLASGGINNGGGGSLQGTAGDANGTGTGGHVTFTAGSGGANPASYGGEARLFGGAAGAGGIAGDALVRGGEAIGAAPQQAGTARLVGGYGGVNNAGGNTLVAGGAGKAGGDLNLKGGAASSGKGGDVWLSGGDGAGTNQGGGNIVIAGGTRTGSGAPGFIQITPAAGENIYLQGPVILNTLANTYTLPTTRPAAGQVLAASDGAGTIAWATKKDTLQIAASDEVTALTTGTAKVTFRMPYGFALTAVRASLTAASTTGNPAIDVNRNGTSIFSTTLTIDANERTSVTAATAAVLSTTSLADDDEITIDIDTAGTGARGLKVTLIGSQA